MSIAASSESAQQSDRHWSILNSAQSNKKIFVDALYKRPESISGFFPFDEYLADHKVYVNKDGSYGAIYKITLLEHEPMTSQEVISEVYNLRSWLDLPENCTLQILYDQSYLSPLDHQFEQLKESYKDAHPVANKLFQEKLSGIISSCHEKGTDRPLTRELYLSIKQFPKTKKSFDPWSAFQKADAKLYEEARKGVRELRGFLHLISKFESNCKLQCERLDADSFLKVLRRTFNPKTFYKRSFAKHNPNTTLSDQIVYNTPTVSYEGIEREGIKTRTISLKTSPYHAYPGGMAYFSKLTFPFKLSLNFSFPTKGKVKRFFDLKEFFLQNTPSAKARRQREEILEVQDRLARDDRCLFLTFTVVVEGESEDELDARTRELLNVFQNDLECEAIVEEDIGLGLFLNTLPLSYSPESDLSSQRYIRILRSDAVNFIPVFDSFRGLENPKQLFLSRENNLVKFSLEENETSNHTILLADSGSGKSAFIINCLQAAKRAAPEPLTFVVDKKSSYTMLSEYFDGDQTVFDGKDQMPFSPFRGEFDDEKVSFLTKLVISAIKLTNPNYELESEQIDVISTGLKLTYLRKVKEAGLVYLEGDLHNKPTGDQVQINMDDFIAELGQLASEREYENMAFKIDELTQKLKPFYGEGTYAKYFRGNTESSRKDCLFYIYDLDALDGDEVLQPLLTMAVVEEIRQTIKQPQNKGRGGYIVIEEIGMLGRNNPTINQFVLDAAETFRKLGFWLISATPRPQNYFELEAGKAMWSVADNFIFMQMNSDNVDYVMEKSSLLDEANSQIIKSLRTIKGKFAEVFYMNKKKTKQGAFRYCQTSLERWLAPTNSKDAFEAAAALKKFVGRKWAALEYLAEKFPFGAEGNTANA